MLPHLVVEDALMSMFGRPATFMKSVGSRPVASTFTLAPLPEFGEYTALKVTLPTSERL
jgi:hypothetical protein